MMMDVPEELLDAYLCTKERRCVLEALEKIDFPESRRGNVIRHGEKRPVYGVCIGMTECWLKGPMPSASLRLRPRLARLLCAFMQHEIPGFEFTSIQVNKDYAARLHVDKNDAGRSMITGLGSYTGGQLWIDDGSLMGRVHDLQGQWVEFDGNNAHCVLPFTGRRYTLVYFTRAPKHGGEVGANPESVAAKRLMEHGFVLPKVCPPHGTYPPVAERLQGAKERLRRFHAQICAAGGVGCVPLTLRREDGEVLQITASPKMSMQKLMEDLEARFWGDSMEGFKPKVKLWKGCSPLMPGDTVQQLALSQGDVIHVQMCDPLRKEADSDRSFLQAAVREGRSGSCALLVNLTSCNRVHVADGPAGEDPGEVIGFDVEGYLEEVPLNLLAAGQGAGLDVASCLDGALPQTGEDSKTQRLASQATSRSTLQTTPITSTLLGMDRMESKGVTDKGEALSSSRDRLTEMTEFLRQQEGSGFDVEAYLEDVPLSLSCAVGFDMTEYLPRRTGEEERRAKASCSNAIVGADATQRDSGSVGTDRGVPCTSVGSRRSTAMTPFRRRRIETPCRNEAFGTPAKIPRLAGA